MSTTIADPLFVRAELEYRREAWSAGPGRRTPAWPSPGRTLRRRLAAGLAHATAVRRAAPTRPRHP